MPNQPWGPFSFFPDDKHRRVLSVPEPQDVLLPVQLPSDLVSRVESWRANHALSMSNAIRRLLESGLEQLAKQKRRGPKGKWEDGRCFHLHFQVCKIRNELEGERNNKVPVEEAIKVLRERFPKTWPIAQNSLETKFYEAERRLKRIYAAYDE
jgi:hypothetical protein